MDRALSNAVIVLLGVAVVCALFPTGATTRRAARLAHAVIGRIVDGTYRVADAIADRRARARTDRAAPAAQEGITSEQHPTDT